MRKLAIVGAAFSAAVLAAVCWLPMRLLPILAGLFALLGLGRLTLRQKWLRGPFLAVWAFVFGLIYVFCFYQLRFSPSLRLDGEECRFRATVTEYPSRYDSALRLELCIQSGPAAGARLLLTSYDSSLMAAEPGDSLVLDAKLQAADQRLGEDYLGYLAEGVSLRATLSGEPILVKNPLSLRFLPQRINHRLLQAVDELFPKDTAAFVQSLMLGEKTALYGDFSLYNALSRAGLMHIAAVSGMHVGFLAALLLVLLGNNRLSSVLGIGLIWLFVLITGAHPSALRAGLMQTLLLFAPLVSRENDPPTSLAAAALLILLLNPYAVAGPSFQLSFSAIAGLLCFYEPIYTALTERFPGEPPLMALRALAGIIAASLSVTVFTTPLMALHFGSVNVLSPLSNLLCLWAVSLCFCGAFLACGLGLVWTAPGKALAWLIAWPVRWIILVARRVSAIPFSTVYLESAFALPWLIFVYLTVVVAALRRKGRVLLRISAPLVLALITLLLGMKLSARYYSGLDGVFTAVDVGQGQSLAVFSGENTVVIDCGSLSGPEIAGERMGRYLLSRGRNSVDVLMLTHLHADHVNGVPVLMEMVRVDRLLLPASAADEDGWLAPLLQAALEHHTQVVLVSEDGLRVLGRIKLQIFAPIPVGDSNERGLSALISVGENDLLVTGDYSSAAEKRLLEEQELGDLEMLVVGHHGSRGACSDELLDAVQAERAVISVGYNRYGHPAAEVLERLSRHGCEVYRTDEDGTVEWKLEKSHG